MSEFTLAIMIIFVFTFVPLILAEIARSKALPSVDDFFLCSRNMSTFMSFFTIYGTWYSTFAVIGSGAYFYFKGPVYMTTFAWNALFAICLFFIGRRIWFYGKTHNYVTPADFFRDIYNSKPLTALINAIMLIFTLPYIQIQFSGGTYVIDIASDGQIPWKMAGLIFYTVMIVYLWAGGLRAVALADVFFGFLVFLTMLCTGLLLATTAGGVNNIFDTLTENNTSNVTLAGNDAFGNTTLWIAMFFVTPLGAIMSPPMWIRHYAVKREKTFYVLPFLITLAAVGYIGCFIAGNAGKILDPNLTDSEVLIPTLIAQHGNKILTALLFCGFAAASLSTANSQIHALAAIYTMDIHKRLINKDASERRLLYIAKWAVLAFSAIAYVVMLASPTIIIRTGLLALSGTLQILVPTLGALFWKKSNATGAFAGLLSGVLTLITLFFFFNLEPSSCGVIGFAVNITVFLIVSSFTKQNPSTRGKIVGYAAEFVQHETTHEQQ